MHRMANPVLTHSWICCSQRSDSFGCSDNEVTELKILRRVRKKNTRVQILDFRWADLSLFRKQISRIHEMWLWRARSSEKKWQVFKDSILQGKNSPFWYLGKQRCQVSVLAKQGSKEEYKTLLGQVSMGLGGPKISWSWHLLRTSKTIKASVATLAAKDWKKIM